MTASPFLQKCCKKNENIRQLLQGVKYIYTSHDNRVNFITELFFVPIDIFIFLIFCIMFFHFYLSPERMIHQLRPADPDEEKLFTQLNTGKPKMTSTEVATVRIH